MSDTTAKLDAIQARLDAATPGAITITPSDVSFLFDLARKQQAAIDAVRALHVEDLFRGHLSNGCAVCGGGAGWPCPTIEATEAIR